MQYISHARYLNSVYSCDVTDVKLVCVDINCVIVNKLCGAGVSQSVAMWAEEPAHCAPAPPPPLRAIVCKGGAGGPPTHAARHPRESSTLYDRHTQHCYYYDIRFQFIGTASSLLTYCQHLILTLLGISKLEPTQHLKSLYHEHYHESTERVL